MGKYLLKGVRIPLTSYRIMGIGESAHIHAFVFYRGLHFFLGQWVKLLNVCGPLKGDILSWRKGQILILGSLK